MNTCSFNALAEFLSTPSARRATCTFFVVDINTGISIHALREEGDFHVFSQMLTTSVFLSTPSARRATAFVS